MRLDFATPTSLRWRARSVARILNFDIPNQEVAYRESFSEAEDAMSAPIVFPFVLILLALALATCVFALRERRALPIRRWRLALVPLLIAAATFIVFYIPPSNDLREPQVWLTGLLAGVLGVARGALISLRVDQAWGRLLLRRAPEGFWIAVVSALFILADILADPVGEVGSSFIKSVELALMALLSFLIGRNAALVLRSRDAPHHDL